MKRVRQASTKYDGDFAVAIPTKGSRGCMKDDEYYATNTTRDEYYEYYVGDESLVDKYYRTDEPLQYARVKSVRKEADESPSTSAGADGVPRPPGTHMRLNPHPSAPSQSPSGERECTWWQG